MNDVNEACCMLLSLKRSFMYVRRAHDEVIAVATLAELGRASDCVGRTHYSEHMH